MNDSKLNTVNGTIRCAECNRFVHEGSGDLIKHSSRCESRPQLIVKATSAVTTSVAAEPVYKSDEHPYVGGKCFTRSGRLIREDEIDEPEDY